MAIATTIAVSAKPSPLSGGLSPLAGTNAPPATDGFDAVFSAILSQVADGQVGNNQPQGAIPAVANDMGIPQISPLVAGAKADAAADIADPLAIAPAATTTNAGAAAQATEQMPSEVPVPNAAKQNPAPMPSNVNVAATVSLLEAQNAPAPAPKSTDSAPTSDSQRSAPKQNGKQAAQAATPDPSLLVAATVAPAPPVAPVAPIAPTLPDEPAAPAAASAPDATPPALPPLGDADDDESDDTPSASSTSPAGSAAFASTDQGLAASTAGDFLADLNSSLGQAQSPAAAPATPSNPQASQFSAAAQPAAARKLSPASGNAAQPAQTNAAPQKSDTNATALTQLAVKDQDDASRDPKSATADPAPQPSAPAPEAAAPSLATLSGAANNATTSSLAAQSQLQTTAATPTATLHVAPQGQTSHASATSDLDSLGVTIAAKSLDGIKHFDIRLDPPELGRVEVRLSVGDDGKAQASLSVDRPQTLQLLQNDASSLNRALKDAGLNLSDAGLSFSLKGQDRQTSDGAPQQRGRSLSVRALASIDAASQVSSNTYTTLSANSAGVDIRV